MSLFGAVFGPVLGCLEPVFDLTWVVLGLSRAILGMNLDVSGLPWSCLETVSGDLRHVLGLSWKI